MTGAATITSDSVSGRTFGLPPQARPPQVLPLPAGMPPATRPEVPAVADFGGLDRWLDSLPGAAYFDGERLWPVATVRDGIHDLRLYPDRADLRGRLPDAGGLRATVQMLLDERRERSVVLVPGEPLRWLTIGDGLVLRLGHEKAILLLEPGGVTLRFFGGERFRLARGANRVGRTPDCAVNAETSPSISRYHAEIWLGDRDSVTIEDLGSRNGTAIEIDPVRLIGTVVDDLRQRRQSVIVGPADDAGNQITHPVAALIARLEAAVSARVTLEFDDEVDRRPTAATLDAVGRIIETITRTDGLRLTIAMLLLAPSVHRPSDPLAACLWPEGLGAVRWSDGLFLDVFGALARRAELRLLLLANFSRRFDGAWVQRFPGSPEATIIVVTAAEMAARRLGRSGPAAALPDGDLVADLAYTKLMQRLRPAGAVAKPVAAGRQAREIVEMLLGPAVAVTAAAIDSVTGSEVLRRADAGQQVFAVRKTGTGAVYAIGRVGNEAAWVELVMPRGMIRRHRLSGDEFRSRFQTVLVVTPVSPRPETVSS